MSEKPKFKMTWYSFLPANKAAWSITYKFVAAVIIATVVTLLLMMIM